MRQLSIDIETYSDVDLKKCGVYPYVESEEFEIDLISYAFDEDEVTTHDTTAMSAEELEKTKVFFRSLFDRDDTEFWAWNANFEITCFSRWLGYPLKLDHWYDTMILAASLDLPRTLKECGKALGLAEDLRKLKDGDALVRYFSKPCKPTKANGMRLRNRPQDAPERWETYKTYNAQDVVSERAIRQKLIKYRLSEREHREWILDQEINRRGVLCDRHFADEAVSIAHKHESLLKQRLKDLTNLDNPNSVIQLKGWLGMDTLAKKTVAKEIQASTGDKKEALEMRLEIGKSSIKKYIAMQNYMCGDDRCRGLFQFYGAISGRFAGRGIQLQNLPQNHIEDLAEARALVKAGDYESLQMLYGDVPDTLSQLIRTAFIPAKGHTFAVADFSAIEARVLAYMADEKWRLKVFEDGGDIYCRSASAMFHVPVVKHGVNGHLRQKGKIAELGCIAYDSPVLTDQGLVPIQNVTKDMKLWDGEEWVNHDGIIYKGERYVISYQGLTATPDHLVFVKEQEEAIPLGVAEAGGYNLVKTGDAPLNSRPKKGKARVYDILNAGKHHRFTVSNCLVHNCGYGGSVGALEAMGALDMGLSPEELPELVAKWREASPNIVKYWWDVGNAVVNAVKNGVVTDLERGVSVWRTKAHLHIQLPSGRCLRYFKPRIEVNRFGSDSVTYMMMKNKKWERVESYGPKFVENIIQGIARDCLMEAMLRVSKKYPRIVMHVHDEMIVEVPKEEAEEALGFICEQMGSEIPWARGLLLRGDGYLTDFYRKD